MKNRNATLWLMATTFCTSGMLSSCAENSVTPLAIELKSGSDTCPLRQKEHKTSVDVSLDKLSLEELTTLANAGRTSAMVLLALRYAPSSDTNARPAPDTDKALALLQKAADKHNADAEYLMGAAHMNGLGVPKDEAKAAYWLERGAHHGNADAQYWFGEMTAKGRGGIASNWIAALPYFRSAAIQGVPDAFLEIGYMHSGRNDDFKQDPQKAAFCYRQVQSISPLAQFNVRRLIDDGKIEWEVGDPGVPLEKQPSSPKN